MAKSKEEKKEYSKRELLQAAALEGEKDLLEALLKEDTLYSLEEVEKLVNDFKEREVR